MAVITKLSIKKNVKFENPALFQAYKVNLLLITAAKKNRLKTWLSVVLLI